ncbi:efflux RND transporter periplasmic adaptor subunit [Flavobacteriaceae bacterium GF1]
MKRKAIIKPLLTIVLPLVFWQCANDPGKSAKSPAKGKAFALKEYQTQRVRTTSVERSISLTGRIIPLQRIDVVSEVQGTVISSKQRFKEGMRFGKGETLLRLEDTKFRYNLTAQKSQFLSALILAMSDIQLDYPHEFDTWNSFLQHVKVEAPLPELPKIHNEQLRYFLASKNILNLYYGIQSGEETLRDYRIVAPFNGAVTKAMVDSGDLVRPGVKVGEFIQTDIYEVKAAVAASDLPFLKVGQKVPLLARNINKEVTGTITRIGQSVDASTQAVTIFLQVADTDLKDGMYLEGGIAIGGFEDAFEIPKGILSRDNHVLLIRDSTVVAKPVTLLQMNSDRAVVHGLSNGDMLIIEEVTDPIQGVRAIAKNKP